MKTNDTYTPHSIDTNDVVLPEELVQLSEQIAENVHEVWAKSRMKEGWTYGEQRDDKKSRPHASCPTTNCPKRKRNTTATPRRKR